LRELWDGAALFLAPRDPQTWTAELNSLLQDEDRLAHLADAAAARAACYTEARSVDAYCSVCAHLLDGEPRTGRGAAA
jgi:hypothetical protein